MRFAACALLALTALMAPAAIFSAVGGCDRVAWVNKDLFPHTVTADGKLLDSHSIAANASWSYVASKKGEYPYRCTFHSTMKGKITVQ